MYKTPHKRCVTHIASAKLIIIPIIFSGWNLSRVQQQTTTTDAAAEAAAIASDDDGSELLLFHLKCCCSSIFYHSLIQSHSHKSGAIHSPQT